MIRGKPDAVNRAINMVTELIKGEPGSATQIIQKYGLGSALQISCPKAIVGRIIGKGGETIKGLQRKYHVSIQIDQVGAAVVLICACAGCKYVCKDVDHPAAQGWFSRTCMHCDAASTFAATMVEQLCNSLHIVWQQQLCNSCCCKCAHPLQ